MTRARIGGLLASLALCIAAPQARATEPAPSPPAAVQPFDRAPGPHNSFMRVVVDDPAAVVQKDKADKPAVMSRQKALLEERYDLRNDASPVMMSGGRKAVQQGVRVRLPGGRTWDQLGAMAPADVKRERAFPAGFLPLPHVKHGAGGMVFPRNEIDRIRADEGRSLERFDVDFDLPDHLMPEFPPPLFLTTRPELGDVSRGQLLTIKNYYDLLNGILTPVQIDGLRLLLTPFPQQQFNQTEDRKVEDPQLGVACLDCHANGHTNATFHLNPDTRPQAARFRIDTVSLRGMFNQQIHGSKRSLRSIEDFTEFEQRTAYFDGDQVTAAKKGVNLPDRASQVVLMAQMQTMFDFPPAPKLRPDGSGRLDPAQATELEQLGARVFFGKGRCASCHVPPAFLDHLMHDLRVERFYDEQEINGQWIHADGPIKTFTLRGIRDSPPYLHDGRLLTLEDTVEFFNLVLQLRLDAREKEGLVHYLRVL